METIKLHMLSGGDYILFEARGKLFLWGIDLGDMRRYEELIGEGMDLKTQLEVASAGGHFRRIVDAQGMPSPQFEPDDVESPPIPVLESKQLETGEMVYVFSGKVGPPRGGI